MPNLLRLESDGVLTHSGAPLARTAERIASRARRLALALLILAPTIDGSRPVAAQNCEVDKGPDHGDWQPSYVTRRALERDLEAIARDAGVLPFGRLRIQTPDPEAEPEITYLGLELPADAQASFRDRVEAFTREHVVRGDVETDDPDTPHYRSMTLLLGVPERPLWPDSTVHCGPVLRNLEEARALMSAVGKEVPNHVPYDLNDRVRFEVWFLLNELGQVETSTLEFQSGPEEYWPGFEPFLRTILEYFRFGPASTNGVPTPAWITQILTFEY